MIEVGSVQEGQQLREALDAFFQLAGTHGIGALKSQLAPLLQSPLTTSSTGVS
jgi:hypothetical protein